MEGSRQEGTGWLAYGELGTVGRSTAPVRHPAEHLSLSLHLPMRLPMANSMLLVALESARMMCFWLTEFRAAAIVSSDKIPLGKIK